MQMIPPATEWLSSRVEVMVVAMAARIRELGRHLGRPSQ